MAFKLVELILDSLPLGVLNGYQLSRGNFHSQAHNKGEKIMLLSFKLSMPSNNAWNGRWTGDGKCYVKIINLGNSKKAQEKGKTLIKKGYYTYSFGDGWVAGITVKQVDSTEAGMLRKNSLGFCGYEWMIASIKYNGAIIKV